MYGINKKIKYPKAALKQLGALYANREGVPQSYSESYVWWSLAAMSGNRNLVKKRDRAAEKLTPGELDIVQQRAAKLLDEIQQEK